MSRVAHEIPKGILGLVMIVKDASNTIRDTLQAIKHCIDQWTILDTGSTDNTIDIIREEMEGIRGNLYEEPFIDFSASRNRAIELAGNTCKYLIMLDDSYCVKQGVNIRMLLKDSNVPYYYIAILDDKNNMYYSPRIFLTDRNFRYKYRVHEVLNTEKVKGKRINFFKTGIHIYDKTDWQSELRTEKRFGYYLKVLKEDYSDSSDDIGTRIRSAFYIAHTYFNIKQYDLALEWYERVLEGYGEQTYEAYYRMANIHEIRGDIVKAIELYTKASITETQRAEPLYRISNIYYRSQEFSKAYIKIEEAYKLSLKFDTLYKTLPIEYKTYTEDIPLLYADLCIKTKETEKAKKIISKVHRHSKNLIRIKNLESVLKSDHSEQKIDSRKVVFYTQNEWNDIGGSEIMVYNLALEFRRRGYEPIIFLKGNIPDLPINFLDCSDYVNYIESNNIEILIVSRFSNSLLYSNTVKKVYLWLHDIYPEGNVFHTHAEKFKGVICLSEWHKETFCTEYKFPRDWVMVIGNAIRPSLYQVKEKVPFRFIYSSNPKRGLETLLKMFPKIQNRYPQATLHIYANQKDIPFTWMHMITSNTNIFLHSRLGQKELAEEYCKSDVWLYPTDWKETFCITALEAQVSRVLCATYSVGALTETVGNRGILASTEEEILRKLFYVLDNPKVKKHLLDKAERWARKQTFDRIAERLM